MATENNEKVTGPHNGWFGITSVLLLTLATWGFSLTPRYLLARSDEPADAQRTVHGDSAVGGAGNDSGTDTGSNNRAHR